MIGWFVTWKCLVACLFLEESQQPTCPHSRQIRRCTHVSPILKQSSQPCALGVTCRIRSRCVHCVAKVCVLSYCLWQRKKGGGYGGHTIASPRCVAHTPAKDARPLHSYVLVCGCLPSMSSRELSELQSAKNEANSIITRKLVIKDSAIACCRAA
jgi:hypothetical protein